MMIRSIVIRSFHRQPHEPNGCVMSSDLPWMSEPSHLTLVVCLMSVAALCFIHK